MTSVRSHEGCCNQVEIFVNGNRCPPQCRPRDLEATKRGLSVHFMVAKYSEKSSLLLCRALQAYVLYPKIIRDDIVLLLHLEEIQIPPNSVLVGHRYLQHDGRGWNGHHGLLYCIYIILNDYNLKNVVAFVHGSSLQPKRLRSSKKPSAQRSMYREESDNKSSDESDIDKSMLKVSDIPDA